MTEQREIVVLGGNLGGVSITHYLLKNTIPLLERRDKTITYHITLITPNTHLFFKIAGPRVLISPTLLPQEQVWKPLTDGFSKYTSTGKLSIHRGLATSLSAARRTVVVQNVGAETETGKESTREFNYDYLFISTGTTSASPLWTLHADQSLTQKAFEAMHVQLPSAKTVLVAGGGAVGVETAGEIASQFRSADITLLSGGTRVLPKVLAATSARAQSYLEKVQRVEVVHGLRVVSSVVDEGGKTTVTLSDGSVRTVDVYVDATGGVANSQFLPAAWLDKAGRVVTKDGYFRVRGGAEGADENAKGVYVLGDIVAGSEATLMQCDVMVPVVASSLAVDVAGAPGQKEYKPLADTIVVPIGREGGVGQAFGWKMPSIMVKLFKGKGYLMNMLDPIVTGSKW